MTPTEDYAAKREEAVALIRQHAPARLQDALIEQLRPAIALTATRANDAQIPVGASKFGGAPDVPPAFVWPTWNDKPLGFLAQINLEEVAPFDIEGLLPKSGLLSFFYDFEKWPWGDGQQKDGWRVFHLQDRPLQRVHPPAGADAEFKVFTAQFSFQIKLSVPDHPGTISQTATSINDWPGWEEFAEQFFPRDPRSDIEGEPQHQILGYSLSISDDARYDAAQASGRGAYQDWRLLFQLDSDKERLNFMWGDMGLLYFLVHQDDLNRADFSHAWCIGQCS